MTKISNTPTRVEDLTSAEPAQASAPTTPLPTSTLEAAPHEHLSALERSIVATTMGLEPGESVELETSASAGEGVTFGFSGKVRIERDESGDGYTVKLGATANASLAPPAADGAPKITARISAEEGHTLHFESARQVADFVDAASGEHLQVVASQWLKNGAVAAGLISPDSSSRLSRLLAMHTTKQSLGMRTELSASQSAKSSLGSTPLEVAVKAAAKGATTTSYEFDRQKGVLRRTTTVELKGDFRATGVAADTLSGTASLKDVTEVPLRSGKALNPLEIERSFVSPDAQTRHYLMVAGKAETLAAQGALVSYTRTTELGGDGKTVVELEVADRGDVGGGVATGSGFDADLTIRRAQKFTGDSLESCAQKLNLQRELDASVRQARTQGVLTGA